MDVMHSHSVLLALACLCWWDRWMREARAGTITLQNKPSCCRAWQGGFGGQQRKGAIGNSSGVAVSQLGKDGRWKELWLLSLASSRAPCPDFCLISSVLHFKTFLPQFHACWKHGKAKEYPRAYNSHRTLSTWCVTCKSKSQGGKSIWGAVGKEHALHSTTHLIPLCPKASRDKQQLMRVPGCSDGPIFIPMQEQQPDTLTKCNVEQQLWQGCVGFRFNSTATTQLCSADSCPGIHQKLLEALSRSLQAQPHIARQFSFLQLLLSA